MQSSMPFFVIICELSAELPVQQNLAFQSCHP